MDKRIKYYLTKVEIMNLHVIYISLVFKAQAMINVSITNDGYGVSILFYKATSDY